MCHIFRLNIVRETLERVKLPKHSQSVRQKANYQTRWLTVRTNFG